MRPAECLGAVLAGGESRRYGRDKAAEIIAGQTLVERAAETLFEVFGEVVIVSSREPSTNRWRHVPDRRTGQGPLAGIESALLHAEELGLQGAFVLACDLPLVDSAVVRSVVAASGEASACAPARAGHPDMEPLCATYRVSALPVVAGALDRGSRSVHGVFAGIGGVTVPLSVDVFLNVNRPEDAARANEVVSRRETLRL